LVASNGLNIYVPERDKVINLYRSIFQTLKPGGMLVTSALTLPPGNPNCEWNMKYIDQKALSRQKSLFVDILKVNWSNFCTTAEMSERLKEAGFINIKILSDSRNIFPTFVAYKP
jgi:hypothetical protein